MKTQAVISMTLILFSMNIFASELVQPPVSAKVADDSQAVGAPPKQSRGLASVEDDSEVVRTSQPRAASVNPPETAVEPEAEAPITANIVFDASTAGALTPEEIARINEMRLRFEDFSPATQRMILRAAPEDYRPYLEIPVQYDSTRERPEIVEKLESMWRERPGNFRIRRGSRPPVTPALPAGVRQPSRGVVFEVSVKF